MKGFLPWLVRSRADTRDFCSVLAALVGLVQNIFFPHRAVHYFNAFVPIAQQAGQAAVLGRLSLSVCLWSRVFYHVYSSMFICLTASSST
jgi:hypothetical protein